MKTYLCSDSCTGGDLFPRQANSAREALNGWIADARTNWGAYIGLDGNIPAKVKAYAVAQDDSSDSASRVFKFPAVHKPAAGNWDGPYRTECGLAITDRIPTTDAGIEAVTCRQCLRIYDLGA